MRAVAAALLVLVGCAALVLAWGPLQNLLGYRDSPIATYLLFGLPLLVAAAAMFVTAWRLLVRQTRRGAVAVPQRNSEPGYAEVHATSHPRFPDAVPAWVRRERAAVMGPAGNFRDRTRSGAARARSSLRVAG